jgi:predicted transcriptional regulator
MRKQIVATRVEPPTYDALKKLARREERSVSFLLRKAVEAYVAGNKAPQAHRET